MKPDDTSSFANDHTTVSWKMIRAVSREFGLWSSVSMERLLSRDHCRGSKTALPLSDTSGFMESIALARLIAIH